MKKLKSIAIIPARSGSKGLKDKNIKLLCGIPLMAYSIRCAKESGMFEKIFVSTDSEEYARIAEEYGADAHFLRSEENSGDKVGSWDVVREVLERFEEEGETFDTIMLLQPTSPLRNVEDIKNSFKQMKEKNANAILSVTEMEHSPLWSNTLGKDLCMDSFQNEEYRGIPRQWLPTYYRLNGAIYLIKKEELQKKIMFCNGCYAYIMPGERSIDIDTELDFVMAEYICEQRKNEN